MTKPNYVLEVTHTDRVSCSGTLRVLNADDWAAAMDGSRPVMTKSGHPVTLYCIDAPGPYPVHGRTEVQNSCLVNRWTLRGVCGDGPYDLVQPAPRIERTLWVNMYHDLLGGTSNSVHETHSMAVTHGQDVEKHLGYKWLACVKVDIDCAEGEGLPEQ